MGPKWYLIYKRQWYQTSLMYNDSISEKSFMTESEELRRSI